MTIDVITENTSAQNAVPDNLYTGLSGTMMKENAPTTNYSTDEQTEVHKYGVGDHANTLLTADLSNLPGGASVSAATLYLYQAAANVAHDIDLREILQAYIESTYTWNVYDTGNNWNTPGCEGAGTDRVDTPVSTTSLGSTTAAYYGLDCTALVAANVGGSISMHLERTEAGEDATFKTFSSSANTNNSVRPELVIVWTSGSFNIDTPPTDMIADTAFDTVISGPATVPTVGNTQIKLTDDSGPAATVNSVTGSDPYTINATFTSTTAAQFGIYNLYVEVDAQDNTAPAIPYSPPAGKTDTDLISPIARPLWVSGSAIPAGSDWYHDSYIYTHAAGLGSSTIPPADGVDGWAYLVPGDATNSLASSILDGYTGDTPVTGDQSVSDILTTPAPNSETITVNVDGTYSISPFPLSSATADVYIIQTDGTIGSERTVTFAVFQPAWARNNNKLIGGL